MDGIKEVVLSKSAELTDEVILLRRHFHRNPELSFEEINTSAFICNWLDNNGISYKKGIAGTGIIAKIKGNGRDGRIVAVRAEMDALPIIEKTPVTM